MITLHFIDTDAYAFNAEERTGLAEIAARTEPEVRLLLPGLPTRLDVTINTGAGVIPETGEVGFAASSSLVHWTVDPARGVHDVAQESFRHTLFHELHHCCRMVKLPGDYTVDWYDGSVFEGLATVFEREAGWSPPYGEYPDDISAWAAELFAQPVDDTFQQWKFMHADGRRWISYRVGAWVVDQAIAHSGRSAADMVWAPTQEIVELAGLAYNPV